MRKIIAVFKDQFAGHDIFNGESLDQVIDALVNDGEDYKNYVFYDLTDIKPRKIKVDLE